MPPDPRSGPGARPGADSAAQRRREHARETLLRLRWPVARRIGVHPWGDERSRLRGPGAEYSDVREYRQGEDARLIDWNLSARSDRLYVRESQPERGLDVWLVLDASRSLDWGTAASTKQEAALELAAAAALLLTRHGSRVGALVFDDRLRRILPPVAGRSGRLALLSRLHLEAAPPGPTTGTDLAGALQRLARLLRRPSLVVVVSDFLVTAGWQKPMRALALRHEVVAARVRDPREEEIPAIGVVTFEDPETGAQLEVDTTSARLRERFRQAAAEQRRALLADLRRAGATSLELSTAQPVLPQLVDFIRRASAGRGPGGGAA